MWRPRPWSRRRGWRCDRARSAWREPLAFRPMAHDVFISHSSKDKIAADAACAVLESHGLRCWIAPRDATPGKSWAAAIVQAINRLEAGHALGVLSQRQRVLRSSGRWRRSTNGFQWSPSGSKTSYRPRRWNISSPPDHCLDAFTTGQPALRSPGRADQGSAGWRPAAGRCPARRADHRAACRRAALRRPMVLADRTARARRDRGGARGMVGGDVRPAGIGRRDSRPCWRAVR